MSQARPILIFLLCLVLAQAVGARDLPGILVTRQLLEDQGLQVGQEVVLALDPAGKQARTYRILGTYEPVPDPMRLARKRWEARLHLPDLQAHLAAPWQAARRQAAKEHEVNDPIWSETVDAVNLRLEGGPAAAEQVRTVLAARAPDLAVEATGGNAGPFAALDKFHLALSLVTVLGASAFLLALIVMRTEERAKLAGILRLLGVPRRRILVQVLLESLFISACGALLGVGFAAAMQGVVNAFFQWRYDTALVFLRITPGVVAECVALAVPLGVLAGVVASWALLRRETLDLLRR